MSGRITKQELSSELVQQIESDKYEVATKAEAEAGASNAKYMTPLRVKEAVPKNVPNGYAGLDANGKIIESALPKNTDFEIKAMKAMIF